jgi:iron complex outermembrane receptor protein
MRISAYPTACVTAAVAAALASITVSGSAAGQEAPVPANTVFMLDEVVVTAQRIGRLPAESVLTSVDIASATILENANVDYTWELFGRMPGIQLTKFGQGTTSGKLSMRAFNGEGEVNAVKLLIDGVPSNSNDGNMPYIDTVFPLDIAQLEVVRGTNDARYGLHSIAGNVNIVTRLGGDYQEARVGYGSWNTLDVQLAVGHESGSFTQNYALGYHDSDGYREHADSTRRGASGKWFYTFSGGARAGLSLRLYRNKADEPGYLTLASARSDPSQSYPFSATDGGDRRINQVSAHFDMPLGDTLSWSSLVWRNRLDDRRYVQFSANVAQQERYTDETHYGFSSTMTLRPEGRDLSVEWGISGEWQDNISQRYRTLNRVRQAQTRDQHFDFNTIGGYVQAVFSPLSRLRLVTGWRVDKITGDFRNALSNVTAPIYDFGWISQPKFSAVVTLAEGYSAYANWGRTFQIGVGAASYKIPPLANELDESTNTGWELGMKFAPTQRLNGRIAWWQQKATGEWRRRLNDPNNDSDNLGATRRNGLDVQVNLAATEAIRLWLAYAWQDSKVLRAGPTLPATQGKQIDHVPHHIITGGLDYSPITTLTLSLGFNGQSDYYLDPSNTTAKFGDFFKLNLGAQWAATPKVSIEAQVKNLTNERSEYVWWDGTQSLHSPADPRAYYLAARLRL